MDLALRLVAAGTGDNYLPSAYTHAPYFPKRLTTTTFSPPLYETLAVITRQAARLSPATRELISELEAHMQKVAARMDQMR
jgi:DNA-binding transcriptional LysR family regulator